MYEYIGPQPAKFFCYDCSQEIAGSPELKSTELLYDLHAILKGWTLKSTTKIKAFAQDTQIPDYEETRFNEAI